MIAMMWSKLLLGVMLFACLHVLVWFTVNLQFVKGDISSKSLQISILLSIPATLCAYFASRYTYEALHSAWSVRFISFGVSYLIFPILTWRILSESMLTPKTLICILLSIIIVLVQIFWP